MPWSAFWKKGWYDNMVSPLMKKLVGITIAGTLVLFAVLAFLQASKPRLEIVIAGEHNPVENHVSIDGSLLSPSGEGGTAYVTKTSAGSRQISIDGPFIRSKKEAVYLSLFGNEKLELRAETRSPDDIAREVIGSSLTNIWGLRVFGTAIVFSVTDTDVADTDEHSHPILILYNDKSRAWERLDGSEVSSIEEVKVPEAGIEYFYELDNE